MVGTTSIEARLTLRHDLVDLAVLLPRHKFLMLIGEFDFDSDLMLSAIDELDLRKDHESLLNRIIRAVNGEGHLVEGDVSIGIGTDVSEHSPDILWAWQLNRTCRLNPPRCLVELAGLR